MMFRNELKNLVLDFTFNPSDEIFDEFSEVKKELWGGEFWEDGYFVRALGDKVTADLIRGYIKYHHDEVHGKQLKLF